MDAAVCLSRRQCGGRQAGICGARVRVVPCVGPTRRTAAPGTSARLFRGHHHLGAMAAWPADADADERGRPALAAIRETGRTGGPHCVLEFRAITTARHAARLKAD